MPQESEEILNQPVAHVLQAEMISTLHEAGSINVLNPFSAYFEIRRLRASQQELSKRMDAIHDQFRQSLNESISGPGFATGVYSTRVTGAGLSALVQIERTWQTLSSTLDQKLAFTFGFFSLYVALISLVVTVIFGIVSLR